mmetsp:Transcript_4674/g.13474  ORF Transcript_4674/g.13474 Transcript_4674/m.13474 type:complete len:212 (+) Transcript_4674:179-814(+)
MRASSSPTLPYPPARLWFGCTISGRNSRPNRVLVQTRMRVMPIATRTRPNRRTPKLPKCLKRRFPMGNTFVTGLYGKQKTAGWKACRSAFSLSLDLSWVSIWPRPSPPICAPYPLCLVSVPEQRNANPAVIAIATNWRQGTEQTNQQTHRVELPTPNDNIILRTYTLRGTKSSTRKDPAITKTTRRTVPPRFSGNAFGSVVKQTSTRRKED